MSFNPILNKTLLSTFLLALGLTIHAQVEFEDELKGIEYNVGFLLTWSTSDEVDNQLFAIERSDNGSDFKTIAALESKAKSRLNKYEYKDLDLGLDQTVYRLRLVSTDGSFSFSPPIKLKRSSISKFSVVEKEKITTELLKITVNTIVDTELECRISSDMGEFISDELKPIKVGLNDYIFDFSGEIDGGYSIALKLGNELEIVNFKKETKDKKGNVASKKENVGGG